jgi:hypothetical protein
MKARIAFGLAVLISLTLGLMSAVASWQRGGSDIERVLWVVAGCCITLAVHVLPAMLDQKSPLWLAWGAALLVVVFGHAQFLTLAEQHAGAERIKAAVPVVAHSSRPAGVVAAELSKASATLARLPESKRDEQRLVVTNLERELKLAESQDSSVKADSERVSSDPVGQRMALLFKTRAEVVMLVVSLFTALVLECLAIVFWRIALTPEIVTVKAVSAPAPQFALELDPLPLVAEKPEALPAPVEPEPAPTKPKRTRRKREAPPTVEEALEAVERGQAKATVTDIRKHLACSQKAAIEIVRQLPKPSRDSSPQLLIAGL